MASGGNGLLTNDQFIKLAEAISVMMEAFAQGYLDIDSETIALIKQDNFYNTVKSNRDMLKRWANQPANSGRNQTKKLARLLYKAAGEGGYVNPNKVHDILGFTLEAANATNDAAPADVLPSPPTPSGGSDGDNTTAATPGGPSLTDDMIFRLSQRFSNEQDVRLLATNGLKVPECLVDNNIDGKKNRQLAAQELLKVWKKKYTSMTQAYTDLCVILRQIGMTIFIPEVLEQHQ